MQPSIHVVLYEGSGPRGCKADCSDLVWDLGRDLVRKERGRVGMAGCLFLGRG